MLVTNSFICDLRSEDSDAISASILASNLAEALWEHFLFIAAHNHERSSICWLLQVIDASGKLHPLLPDGKFAFNSTKSALVALAALQFPKTITTGTQDPLVDAINQSSFGSCQTMDIFLSSQFEWSTDFENCVNRAILAETGHINVRSW
jgi:hypothetical protein